MKIFMFLLGKILCILQFLSGLILLVELSSLQMLPPDYFAVSAVIAVCLVCLSAVLTWSGKGRAKMIIGIILSVIVTFSCVFSTIYIEKTRKTFDNISTGTEIVHVGIYVRKDNAEENSAAENIHRYGYLQNLDHEGTDAVIQQITDFFAETPILKPYLSLPSLIDALLNNEVDAIILNQSYLDILQEMDGYKDVLDRIQETELKKVEIKPKPTVPKEEILPDDFTEPFGVYISGIDTRGPVAVRSRSDVNILAVVNPKSRQVLLVSTPRDYYVPLSISNGVPDKLTHAGIYGINVSKDTLGLLYGVDMNYYFRINFTGFEKLIDALGGITVRSEYTFKAGKGRYQIQKGDNNLNGQAALAFCRERYALGGGDRVRGKHQMAVIRGVINKALSPALLQNYNSVLKSVEGCFETSIPLELIGNLVAQQLKDGTDWNIVSYSVDGTGDYQIPYSMSVQAYVMKPDYTTVDQAKTLIQKVYNGEILE